MHSKQNIWVEGGKKLALDILYPSPLDNMSFWVYYIQLVQLGEGPEAKTSTQEGFLSHLVWDPPGKGGLANDVWGSLLIQLPRWN